MAGFQKKQLKGDAAKFGRMLIHETCVRHDPRAYRRVQVLHETLECFESPQIRRDKLEKAKANVDRWKRESELTVGGKKGSTEHQESSNNAKGNKELVADLENHGDESLVGAAPCPTFGIFGCPKEPCIGDPGAGQGDSDKASLKRVSVLSGDWGEVTHKLTKEFGATFAVLNMANAYVAGGGYVEGMIAQEENMFRRSDCHFSVDDSEFDQRQDRYHDEITNQISAKDGRVPLDVDQPRVCIRGPEDRDRDDLGYDWLPDGEIFPFYELRAAAVDLRPVQKVGKARLAAEMRRRIDAQLDTLIEKGVRHAVLSAFGCGAFLNPAELVATCYKEALESEGRLENFDCVAFAIFNPGYGPDNLKPFKDVLRQL